MGANNSSRVGAAKPKIGGGIWWAPLGTVIPTDSTTALTAAFKCIGPISVAGVRPDRSVSSEKEREWDGSVLADLLTEENRSFEFDVLGVFDQDALNFIYGSAQVTITPATAVAGTRIAIVDKGGQQPPGVLVLEMQHNGIKQRKVVPVGQATVTSERAYIAGGLRGWTARVEATKDEAGAFVYEYDELNDRAA